jgi:hypothetical protein
MSWSVVLCAELKLGIGAITPAQERLRCEKAPNVNTRILLLANDNRVKATGYRKSYVSVREGNFLGGGRARGDCYNPLIFDRHNEISAAGIVRKKSQEFA